MTVPVPEDERADLDALLADVAHLRSFQSAPLLNAPHVARRVIEAVPSLVAEIRRLRDESEFWRSERWQAQERVAALASAVRPTDEATPTREQAKAEFGLVLLASHQSAFRDMGILPAEWAEAAVERLWPPAVRPQDDSVAGSEVREEWGVRYPSGKILGPYTEEHIRGVKAKWPLNSMETLVRRTVSTSPWSEVQP